VPAPKRVLMSGCRLVHAAAHTAHVGSFLVTREVLTHSLSP
jgi:hypothetical protein